MLRLGPMSTICVFVTTLVSSCEELESLSVAEPAGPVVVLFRSFVFDVPVSLVTCLSMTRASVWSSNSRFQSKTIRGLPAALYASWNRGTMSCGFGAGTAGAGAITGCSSRYWAKV